MQNKKHHIKLKLNVPLAGNAAGSTIKIKADAEGTALDFFWRQRINDSEHDNCVSVVGRQTTGKKKK